MENQKDKKKKLNYAGMTVNERLYLSGQLKEFDAAIDCKDKAKLIEILRDIEVDEPSIQKTVERVLK